MENVILTEIDKRILRNACKYFRSVGVRSDAIIRIDSDWYDELTSYFSGEGWVRLENYSYEVPKFCMPVLEKITEYISGNNLIDELDIDTLNYDNLLFIFDVVDYSLYIDREYGYEDAGDSSGITFGDSDNEDENKIVKGIIDEVEKSATKKRSDGSVQLDFSGSGDSGSVDGAFYDGGRVPQNVDYWCSDVLNSNFGGWENNEGSQGYFTFDLKNKLINLEFTYNEIKEESDEILKIYFDKKTE
jgi:hypothetical protein